MATGTDDTATWGALLREAPELAGAIRARLDATKHHVLATLRADGSPRVSGTEVQFHGEDLIVGMMPGSRKARDLERDGRFALHTNPGDGTMTGGDAKISGRARLITDPDEFAAYAAEVPGVADGTIEPAFPAFRLGLVDAVLTSLHPDGDRLVIEVWRPGQGVRRAERT
jgi:hypothetical protein